MTDKLAVTEDLPDTTTIIRGSGLLNVLGQFTWTVRHDDGVQIPTSKLAVATGSLKAASYTVVRAGSAAAAAAPSKHRLPLPLPECAADGCGAPYPRAHTVRPGEHCTRCGRELRFVQVDPNETDDETTLRCPVCERRIRRGWAYCGSCGAALGELALTRAQQLQHLTADLFTIPAEETTP